jgi:hypothetical protein
MVLLPLFVEVILTFALLFWSGALHSSDLRAGRVKPENIALREPNWPKRTTQVSNAYSNQTELPTPFYVLTILAYFSHHAGYLFVVLAWVFVVFRLLHVYVHVTAITSICAGRCSDLARLCWQSCGRSSSSRS